MRAILLDTETGGLEPATDALCSIGAVVFDTDAPTVDECILARAHWPICVPHDSPLRVTPEALRVQGLTRDDLADSGRLEEGRAIGYFNGWSGDVVTRYGIASVRPWAWNAAFDGPFLKAARTRNDRNLNPRVLCAQQLAWTTQALGLVWDRTRLGILPGPPGHRLMHWAEHYGLTQPEPHNAQADAEVAAKVLWHLARALKGRA